MQSEQRTRRRPRYEPSTVGSSGGPSSGCDCSTHPGSYRTPVSFLRTLSVNLNILASRPRLAYPVAFNWSDLRSRGADCVACIWEHESTGHEVFRQSLTALLQLITTLLVPTIVLAAGQAQSRMRTTDPKRASIREFGGVPRASSPPATRCASTLSGGKHRFPHRKTSYLRPISARVAPFDRP